MNIFGGGSGGGSKRVRCDGSDSELEAIKARDVFSELGRRDELVDGDFAEVGEAVDSYYKFEGDARVRGDNHMVYGIVSDGSVENAFSQRAQGVAKYSNFLAVFDEPQMRDFLFALHGVIRSKDLSEDEKWESINGTYCQLSMQKERRKAEVLRTYFRKLDTVFKRKDGTTYSKVVSADKAQEIIEELIEVYPWDVPIKVEVKPKSIKVDKAKDDEIASIKDAVNNMVKIIEQINNRLEKV